MRAIGRVAREGGFAFVVVAGDVFESNQVDRKTVSRALEALATIPVPIYLLPGNHDALDAASVYRSPTFVQRKPEHVHVIAVNASNAAYRTLSLAEGDGVAIRDLRLTENLDPARHFSQHQQATVLGAGGVLTLPDARSSEFETYDSLAGVYAVLAAVNAGADPAFAEFAFLLDWPGLPDAKKRELYSKYACHGPLGAFWPSLPSTVNALSNACAAFWRSPSLVRSTSCSATAASRTSSKSS